MTVEFERDLLYYSRINEILQGLMSVTTADMKRTDITSDTQNKTPTVRPLILQPEYTF